MSQAQQAATLRTAARIAELEAQLVAEAARTANEKLRADQMTEQHRMQCKMRAELEAKLSAIRPVANCYSDDNGDTWRDGPDNCDFVHGLELGAQFELQASIRSWTEVFRVTKVPDETSDDYEVELVLEACAQVAIAAQAQRPEAIIFADDRPQSLDDDLYQWAIDAEDLIRRLHARIAELEERQTALANAAAIRAEAGQ